MSCVTRCPRLSNVMRFTLHVSEMLVPVENLCARMSASAHSSHLHHHLRTILQVTVDQCAARCLAVSTCSHFVHAGKLGACGLVEDGTCSPYGPKAGTVSYARLSSRTTTSLVRKADERAKGDVDWRCIAPQNRRANRTIVWRTRYTGPRCNPLECGFLWTLDQLFAHSPASIWDAQGGVVRSRC